MISSSRTGKRAVRGDPSERPRNEENGEKCRDVVDKKVLENIKKHPEEGEGKFYHLVNKERGGVSDTSRLGLGEFEDRGGSRGEGKAFARFQGGGGNSCVRGKT